MLPVQVLTTLNRTDVEQEANGLYTCDRKEKIEASKVKALMEETAELFYTIQWHLVNP